MKWLRPMPSGNVHLVDDPEALYPRTRCGKVWPRERFTDDYPPQARRCPRCEAAEASR